jgi:predicted Fe-Mo cluster-binding NifX family protein
MNICVTSQGNTLESQVDPRFGRCAFFMIVETDTMEYEAVENSSVQAMGGAGVQSGKVVVEKGANVLLTGNVGPNAYQILQAAGIEIITGASGTVKEVIDRYISGGLKPTAGPNVESHFGLQGGN